MIFTIVCLGNPNYLDLMNEFTKHLNKIVMNDPLLCSMVFKMAAYGKLLHIRFTTLQRENEITEALVDNRC